MSVFPANMTESGFHFGWLSSFLKSSAAFSLTRILVSKTAEVRRSQDGGKSNSDSSSKSGGLRQGGGGRACLDDIQDLTFLWHGLQGHFQINLLLVLAVQVQSASLADIDVPTVLDRDDSSGWHANSSYGIKDIREITRLSIGFSRYRINKIKYENFILLQHFLILPYLNHTASWIDLSQLYRLKILIVNCRVR